MRKILACLLLFVPFAVSADCTFSGKKYPQGTVINGYVCGEDDKWNEEKE